MAALMADPMLDEAWTLSASVALRPEPFGALAYHFGNRKLTFLKKQELVDVVNALGDCDTVADALTQCGIKDSQWPAYAKALRGLAASDMILERTPS
jgi:putative mycofactocin binding protein MftB